MNIETIKPIADEVLADLGIDGKQVTVETATDTPASDAVQIRILDAAGEPKSVIVNLRDADGRTMNEDDIRHRLHEQLATFRETTLH